MSVNLSLFAGAGWQFFDNNGVPLAGGLIYTYAAGTTTPQTTYTSSTGGTAHANPIVLNSAGRVATGEVWISEGVNYKFVLKDSTFNTIGTYDNINGTYVASDLANTTDPALGDALVGFRQSDSSGNLTGAVGRTVHQKLQESVSVLDFGAVGDGTTDDYAAFRAALDSLPATGGRLYVPTAPAGSPVGLIGKHYRISQTLLIQKPVHIVGDISTGSFTKYNIGSILRFDADTAGFIFNSYNSAGNDGSNNSANGSRMESIGVTSAGGTATVDGVLIRAANIYLSNVWTFSFKRDGIRIRAAIGGGGELEGNANLWSLQNINSELNGGNGLFVDGADSNAGTAINVNGSNNLGWGIYDSSFLGNTYLGCHTDGNTLGPYKTDDPNASNVFVGCYTETGLSEILYPSCMIGGNAGATSKVSATSTGFVFNGAVSARLPFTYENGLGADPVGVALGANDSTLTALSFGATSQTLTAWKLKWDSTTKGWYFQYANSFLYEPLTLFDSASARAAVGSGPLLGNYGAGYYVGSRAAPILRGFATAAPVAGAYVVGDIVYNSAPTAGGTIGWVCTTAGTPGTWKTFGAIAA